VVFTIAGVWGLLLLTPLFMIDRIGRNIRRRLRMWTFITASCPSRWLAGCVLIIAKDLPDIG
jgi:hypothetical protein